MFKHIAIPTDGSKLADKGVKAGVKLAQSLGARVTGVYVVPPYRPPVYGEAAIYYVPGMSPEEYKQQSLKAAKKALAAVEIEAETAGVRCDTRIVTAERPHDGILRAARAAKCDAIAMASHGRGAVGGLLLGSETTRVLSHSRLPVLVTR
jgi:nucleotide-binding universal stress UspA family protein